MSSAGNTNDFIGNPGNQFFFESNQTESDNVTTSNDNSTHVPRDIESTFSCELACFVLVISCGLVGTAANFTVLAALLTIKRQTKSVNRFIMNQVGLDLFASISLVVSYSAKINDLYHVYSDDVWSNILCRLLANGWLTWAVVTSAIFGLAVLTLDRYFLIVHPLQYRTLYSPCATRIAIAVACISGFLLESVELWSSQVKDGKCYKFAIWSSATESMAFSIVSIVIQYFFPLAVFFFGYGSILMVIKRRPGDLQSRGQGRNDVKNEDVMNQRIQMNIIKMLITVTVAFVIYCSPNQIYFMLICFKVIFDEYLFYMTTVKASRHD